MKKVTTLIRIVACVCLFFRSTFFYVYVENSSSESLMIIKCENGVLRSYETSQD